MAQDQGQHLISKRLTGLLPPHGSQLLQLLRSLSQSSVSAKAVRVDCHEEAISQKVSHLLLLLDAMPLWGRRSEDSDLCNVLQADIQKPADIDVAESDTSALSDSQQVRCSPEHVQFSWHLFMNYMSRWAPNVPSRTECVCWCKPCTRRCSVVPPGAQPLHAPFKQGLP